MRLQPQTFIIILLHQTAAVFQTSSTMGHKSEFHTCTHRIFETEGQCTRDTRPAIPFGALRFMGPMHALPNPGTHLL